MRNRNKFTAAIILAAAMFIGPIASAQATKVGPGMMGVGSESPEQRDDHTAGEEIKGKEIWTKLQNKEISCGNLSEENFAALGEYFMGLMMGDSHSSMNEMMVRMMGEEGEEEMHAVMGKRLSGCNASAAFSSGARGFMPMMQMMGGGGYGPMTGEWGSPYGYGAYGQGMMGYGNSPYGWTRLVSTFLWWLLAFVAVFALFRWAAKRGRSSSAAEVLKERYAKGEITKKEFEEIKKELD